MTGPTSARPDAAPLIVEGVSLARGGRLVLDRLGLEVGDGEVLALLGASGSGKSTLLRVVAGLTPPDAGRVLLRGRVVSRPGVCVAPPEARGVAVVFQDLALWPHLTVGGNLAFGLRARGAPRGEERRRVAAALERVGLAGAAARVPGELSGGERQRVAIARALVLEPDLVLLDEPLSDLDVGLRDELLDLFAELFRERAAAVLYITHDPAEARRLADRVAVLDGGRIVFRGDLDDLDPDHASAFVRALWRHERR